MLYYFGLVAPLAQAYAQQLKNKDIPEGGAKAAVLLEPDDSDNYIPTLFGQSFMIRKVVRAFTESILDLTSGDARVVDLLGKDELIYLGPDENIVPQDIDWIINRAVQRNYVMPQVCNKLTFVMNVGGLGQHHLGT